jgi:hypothetical protein
MNVITDDIVHILILDKAIVGGLVLKWLKTSVVTYFFVLWKFNTKPLSKEIAENWKYMCTNFCDTVD